MQFTYEFFPTKPETIADLCEGIHIEGKVFLDPSAGSGYIVDYLQEHGAKQVIACELDKDLKKILQTKCKIIADDFLTVTSDQVSHVDAIIMNPPFSKGAEHILHAFNIAPAGCQVRALCNLETINNPYSKTRKELETLVNTYGSYIDLGDCFSDADRKTDAKVAKICLDKPGTNYEQEFAGFFLDEDPEEQQANGLIQHNVIRELVNRYVAAVKIFDQQLETAIRLSEMTSEFYGGDLGFQVTRNSAPIQRNDFKKGMQKSGWQWVFSKLNLTKHTTRGLKEDINKFVETQENIPFTMKNIYHMLDMVIQTTGQRMDKAIIEVFDKITKHSHDNEYRVEGWKTNSHYLLTKRFIAPSYCKENMEDMVKALCYITGENYDYYMSLEHRMNNKYTLVDADGKLITEDAGRYYNYYLWTDYEINTYGYGKQALEKHPGSKIEKLEWDYGKWFDWGFFTVRHYKKGTYHFEFKDEKLWAQFNQHVARIKGYPLPEKKEQTKYQERQNGRKPAQAAYKPTAQKPTILATFNV